MSTDPKESPLPSVSEAAEKAGATYGPSSAETEAILKRISQPDRAILQEARTEASQRLQGLELMQVVTDNFSEEERAAAEADRHGEEAGEHKKTTRGEIRKQAMVMTKLALGGDVSKLSPEEMQVITGESGDWKESAQKWLESNQKRVQELELLSEARGELPKKSLKVEQGHIAKIEVTEAQQVIAGREIIDILKDDNKAGDIESLRTAVKANEVLESARDKGARHLQTLRNSLLKRYPGSAEEIKAKYDSLVGEGQDARKQIELHTEVGEVAPEAVSSRVQEIIKEANLQRPANRDALFAKLGVKVEGEAGQETYTLEENSPILSSLQTEGLLQNQESDLKSAIEKATEDPKLADAALSIALTRYATNDLGRLTKEQIGEVVQKARIAEMAQIADEKSQLESQKGWVNMKKVSTAIAAKAGQVGNATAMGTARILGRTTQALGAIALAPAAILAAPGMAMWKGGELLADRAKLNQDWANQGIKGGAESAKTTQEEQAQKLEEQIKALNDQLTALKANK